MNILITGGAGFIGCWLLESLAAAGHDVTVLDSLSAQVHGTQAEAAVREQWFSQPGRRLVVADVRDRDTVDHLLADVEAVVHLAAETGTGQSMYQIAHYVDVNVAATATLLELIGLRHRHIRRLVLASSRSVYGEGAYRLAGALVSPESRTREALEAGRWEPTGPAGELLQLVATPEECPLRPASVYAATKHSMEELGRIFSEAYGVPTVALRLQNVYGERQSLVNPYTGILSIFSNRMREHKAINIFEDGLESRDFVHVGDVVRAMQLALERELRGFHTLNIGSGVATSVLTVTRLLAEHLASDSQIHITGDFRVGDIRHCFADIGRARTVLGFEPATPLAQGLAAFCNWVRTQPVQVDRSVQAQKELASLGLGKSHQ
jgi:dTDP-L-rhamnose 4-epimerase